LFKDGLHLEVPEHALAGGYIGRGAVERDRVEGRGRRTKRHEKMVVEREERNGCLQKNKK
jgi:hypothetical protein